jgi:hypothetical protein
LPRTDNIDEPLAGIHDELKILNDRRLIGGYLR